MAKRYVLRHRTGSTTDGDKRLLKRIRSYQKEYSALECVQTWHDVRSGNPKQFPRRFLHRQENRVPIVMALVAEYRKENPGRYPPKQYFSDNRLDGMISKMYNGSPYAAFVEAGFTDPTGIIYDDRLAKTPWTALGMMPLHFWSDKKNRVRAVRWAVKELEKPPARICAKDLTSMGLRGIFNFTNSSPYRTLREAGYKVEPWEMNEVPNKFWQSGKNRKKAIRRMVEKNKKPVTEITVDDFEEAGIGGMLRFYYEGRRHLALEHAGYEFDPADMDVVPHRFWQKKENRVKYVRRFVEKSGKSLAKIDTDDLKKAGLSAILYFNDGSPIKVLMEAGYDIRPSDRQEKPKGYWNDKFTRRKCVIELVTSSKRLPQDLECNDFCKNNLGTVLTHYYNGSACSALKDAGFDVEEIDMRRAPNGAWKNVDNVRLAMRRVMEKTGKGPDEIMQKDILDSGFDRPVNMYGMDRLRKIATSAS